MLCDGQRIARLHVFLLVILLFCGPVCNEKDKEEGIFEEPYLDPTVARNITVHAGNTANLVCRVLHLDDRSVTWIRHSDLHLLTVGDYVYIQDPRMHIFHHYQRGDWTLTISNVTPADTGIYECQVNTITITKMLFTLNVKDLKQTEEEITDEDEDRISLKRGRNAMKVSGLIIGEKNRYVASGESFNLSCLIQNSRIGDIGVLEWVHNETALPQERNVRFLNYKRSKDILVSHAHFESARESDRGVYYCRYGPEESTRVNVWVEEVSRSSASNVPQPSLASSAMSMSRVTGFIECSAFSFFVLIIVLSFPKR